MQKDDMQPLLSKMVEADVIVLATPVYFIAAAAAGKGAMERTIDGFRGFTDCLPGAQVKGVVYGAGAWEKGEIQGSKAMEEAYSLGLNA